MKSKNGHLAQDYIVVIFLFFFCGSYLNKTFSKVYFISSLAAVV